MNPNHRHAKAPYWPLAEFIPNPSLKLREATRDLRDVRVTRVGSFTLYGDPAIVNL